MPSTWCCSPTRTASPVTSSCRRRRRRRSKPWPSALKKLFDAPNPVRVIGTRHGEKLFETLLTREERVKAEDLGNYFRVPADNRDLNYNAYFGEGQEVLSNEEDYHSHNTDRLDVEGMKAMLLKLDLVQAELENWRRTNRTAGARA